MSISNLVLLMRSQEQDHNQQGLYPYPTLLDVEWRNHPRDNRIFMTSEYMVRTNFAKNSPQGL